MQLNSISTSKGTKSARRIGRGGKRGKTSGKGHKGQKSRAGHKIRPEERDIIKRIPKRRGYGKNRARTVHDNRPVVRIVNLRDLEAACEVGETVGPRELVAKGLVNRRAGRTPAVKVLAVGTLNKKLTVTGCAVSKTAQKAIEDAGGTIVAAS